MGQVVVRYKVKPDRVEENEQLVRRVYEELAERDPGTIRYATFRLADGVTFVHVASLDSEAANPLPTLPAFQAFTRDIADRCDEPPLALDATVVGSYGLFG
jgi:quinol monooxygenase YgiN